MNNNSDKRVNLILSGGGIKGIAYIGVFKALKDLGYIPANIAGVSAGALAGSFMTAGYDTEELRKIMYDFDFGKLDITRIPQKVPAVETIMQYYKKGAVINRNNIRLFMSSRDFTNYDNEFEFSINMPMARGNFFKNLVTFSKEGSLYDGDLLEDWVYTVLARKGIRTFGDLRGGIKDRLNPKGYKVRMTAVDVNRAKLIVLPDDISFYGIDPDKLEVARAVRMSTAVPFVFKAVEIKKKENNKLKTHYFVDGGVLDNLPMWMISNFQKTPKIAFKLYGGDDKVFSLNTPLKALKALVSAVHDTGVPKNFKNNGMIVKIDVSKVSTLDFNLDDDEKEYLYNSGLHATLCFFKNLNSGLGNIRSFFYRLLGR